jgi:hypothetical protein
VASLREERFAPLQIVLHPFAHAEYDLARIRRVSWVHWGRTHIVDDIEKTNVGTKAFAQDAYVAQRLLR